MTDRLWACGFKVRHVVMMSIIIQLPLVVGAAEIYGRVSQSGQVLSGANVSISCPGFSTVRDVETEPTGVYRISGPPGEEECTIQVNGSNFVTVLTSTGRTRANLEIVNDILIRR